MPTQIILFIKISLPHSERHFLFSLIYSPSPQDEETLLHQMMNLPINIVFPFNRAGMTSEEEEAFTEQEAHILVHTHIIHTAPV